MLGQAACYSLFQYITFRCNKYIFHGIASCFITLDLITFSEKYKGTLPALYIVQLYTFDGTVIYVIYIFTYHHVREEKPKIASAQ